MGTVAGPGVNQQGVTGFICDSEAYLVIIIRLSVADGTLRLVEVLRCPQLETCVWLSINKSSDDIHTFCEGYLLKDCASQIYFKHYRNPDDNTLDLLHCSK